MMRFRSLSTFKAAATAGLLVVLGLMGAGSSFASVGAPWWHVSVSSRPSNLQAGVGRNEVRLVTVSATGGYFYLEEPVSEKRDAFPPLPYNATHEEVQKALEGIYGAGNVEVPKGEGNEAGSDPYEVIFKGELADQPVPLVAKGFPLNCCGFSKLSGGREEASVSEKTKGMPDGQIVVVASNLGEGPVEGETEPVRIADALPPGLEAIGIEGVEGGLYRVPLQCSSASLSCTFEGKVPPYETIEVRVSVRVKPGASSGEEDTASVAGGRAGTATGSLGLLFAGEPVFGVQSYELTPEEEGGGIDTQAGSHPFQLTTTMNLDQTGETEPVAAAKDLHFKLPPGLIGNPTPFPRCTIAQFLKLVKGGSYTVNECRPETAVGVAMVSYKLNGQQLEIVPASLFNLEPEQGEPARFGFYAAIVPVVLDVAVRTGGDYGVTVNVNDISQLAGFISSQVTFWGVPGDPRHDNVRGSECVDEAREGLTCQGQNQLSPPPLLSMPTSCTGVLQSSMEADSWLRPGAFGSFALTAPLPAMDGCNRLPFAPSISVAPDVPEGSSPSGLTIGIHVPQDATLNPTGLAESTLKDTTVTLPAGVSLNPGTADGLEACSDAQAGFLSGDPLAEHLLFTPDAGACPDGSKVATVKIRTPLLPNALEGDVYIATQNQNPFSSLFALYLVAQDPVSGTVIKLAGEVKPDPVTGQIVTTFKNTPPLPFEDLEMHFFGGERAPLGTPGLCGSYTTSAVFAPWSGNAAARPSSTFKISSGPNGSPCENPLPFVPSLSAGTTSIQAGGFSPFTMTMSREDGNQDLRGIVLHMPPGLSGLLSGVQLCGEAQADAGTCGANSLIGETTVSVGLGGSPYSVKGGRVYITGPYEGAPFGVSVVVRAKAGPYDLGQVVVRGRIEVDRITSALTVSTDTSGPYAIPHILDGIPLQIKHVNFTTTRSGFTFNPTNCNPLSVTGSLSSVQGATSALSVPFQVTNCATLAFKPQFSVSTSGRTSRAGGASLHVKLAYPKAPFGSQANIGSVKVDLPKQLPSRLTTLQKACPDSTFNANPAACPAASKIGTAKATTPLIPVPLTGPAYFVSHGGTKFPELIIVLQGYGVTVDLHSETFINKAGITSSTFRTIPDVPVGTFELTLPQGPDSALAANGNLCSVTRTVLVKRKVRVKSKNGTRTVTRKVRKRIAGSLVMPTAFTAQNGAVIHQNTPIEVTGCGKTKKAKTNRHVKRYGKKHNKK